MELILIRLLVLLIVASIVAIIARRFHLPYTVGLVLTGVSLSVLGVTSTFDLTHDLIFDVMLPPLLFEAALSISWPEFRQDAGPVIVLATIGVIVSAVVVAVGLVELLDWPLAPAAVFGTLIAATDPVSVIAILKDNHITGRVKMLVESESLLNDGVAAVLFGLVLAWAQGGTLSTELALWDLATTVGGGLVVGILTATAVLAVAGHTDDHLVETILTTVAAYGSFLAAEHLHVSGILATISAGLVLGQAELFGIANIRFFNLQTLSQNGQEFLDSFWEFVAFLANSLIFLLIGLSVAGTSFDGAAMTMVSVSALLVLLARAVAVYGLCLPFSASRQSIPVQDQHILWWGGLRGALALALALSLPRTLEYRQEITVATFGVVALSIIVQGLTMPSLLKSLGLLPMKREELSE